MNAFRRSILACALIAGLSPAFAQAPAPVPALPDAERRTSYSITASTCACSVGFALYGDSTDYQNWVEVWINGVNVPYNSSVSAWTITSPSGPLANIARPITDAVLTFAASQTGTIQIVGARRPRRVSQFSENRGVAARDLNQALTDIIAQNRETWDRGNDISGRSVRVPPGETLAVLPPVASRANMGLCFDSSGQISPCIGASTGTFAAGNGVTFTGTNPTSISVGTYTAGTGIIFTGSPVSTVTTDPSIIPTLGANSWTGRQMFSPALGGVLTTQSIGIFLTPTLGSGRTSGSFLTPYNLQWGTSGSPIPAGSLGSLDGYECNQDTSQVFSDNVDSQGNHCFGSTMTMHGGAQAQGAALTAIMDTIAGVYFGLDVNLVNNVAGGQMTGLLVNSAGSQPGTAGFQLNGSFVNGIKLAGNNIVGVTYQTMVPSTFAALPTCGVAVSNGTSAVINDSTVSTWGANAAGGGTATMLVFCNGANWTVAGK